MKYVWPQMRKYKLLFFGAIGFFAVRVIFNSILRPFYLKYVIDAFSVAQIENIASHNLIYNAIFWVLLAYVIGSIFGRTSRFLFFLFNANMVRDLRNFAFQKIEQNSYSFFSNTYAGSLVTKSRRLITSFERMSEVFIYSFVNLIIALTGSLIILTRESRVVGSVFFIFVLLNLAVVAVFVKKKMKYDILSSEQDSKISGRLADVFSNILAVKFFSARENEIQSFSRHTEEGFKREKQAWFWAGRGEIANQLLNIIFQGVVLYIMVTLWAKGEVSIGTIVLVQMYMSTVGELLWELSGSLTGFMRAVSEMKEVVDIFEIKPDILNPENPEKSKMTKGNIKFNNVSFLYKNGKEVLENFNLDIKAGERIGLVGHSGAGKSTVINLILRLMDVHQGSITIDDQDIRMVTQEDLRRVISYVPQESMLFHRSIKENIAYGKIGSTEEEVIASARKAHADEFISVLQKGYNTLVGERGVKLSGGERQRVAIARAMLKDSPILILDEATSSLDSISESYIQDAFNELMKGKTAIVIAHRLSTIQKMDRIIVLDAGKIVEEGTHSELLNKKGFYANLWEHQTGGFLQ